MALPHKHPGSCLYSFSIAALLFGLTGCGGTGQDEGHTSSESHIIKGVAVDGHIARALVFADFDNNGTRDAWEPFAFTDDEGYFSYNPRTRTDYCDDSQDGSNPDYCLRLERAFDQFVIRVDGGYDTLTGEPFVGQISRRVDSSELDTLEQAVVTPLTTLISSVSDPLQQDIILANADLDRSDLNVDYLDRGTQTVDYRLFNKALKIHKSVTVLADRVQDVYTEIGSAVGTPNDLTSAIYANLASALSSDVASLEDVMTNPEVLQQLMEGAEQQARAIYDRRDLVLPSQATTEALSNDFARAAGTTVALHRVADYLVPAGSGSGLEGLRGRTRALEALVAKSLDENLYSTGVDRALAFFLDHSQENLITALTMALDDEAADLTALVRTDFGSDAFDSVEGVTGSARLPSDALPYRDLPGMRLRASDLDLGHAPYNLRDAEVEMYFKGAPAATHGSFDACVKYIDGASSDGRLGDANTRGELVHGQWSLMGADVNNGASYSLLLTIKFLNATYQAIMKPAGFETVNGESLHKVRFDYAGDYRTWHSTEGLRVWNSLPVSNRDCEARLPSRVGL